MAEGVEVAADAAGLARRPRPSWPVRQQFQPARPWFCGRFEALGALGELGEPLRPAILLLLAPAGGQA
ncbi:MAG: hypothetical protein R3F43_28235 [bacterium]